MKKRGGKDNFDKIWDLIDDSVIIILVYSLLDLFLSINSYVDKLFPSVILNYAVIIFAFGLIGYKTIKKKESPGKSARYGAYAGLIVGLIGAIIGIITFYMYPERIAEALQQAAQQGADIATVEQFMKIGIYANLVLSPVINAGIGALIAWISGLIFRKR